MCFGPLGLSVCWSSSFAGLLIYSFLLGGVCIWRDWVTCSIERDKRTPFHGAHRDQVACFPT